MRRLFTIILSIILTVSFAIPSLAVTGGLNDLGDSKYKVEIEKLVEDGTISGYVDGTFKPQNGITRGELAKILAVTLNLEEDKDAAEHFDDVKGKWNQGFVGALYKTGTMVGVGQDKFGQDNNVTREELAVILLRIFDLETIADELSLDVEFVDFEETADWAKNAVAFINRIGLMNGIGNEDGSFSFLPKAFGERELIAKLVYELKYNREIYEEIIATIQKDVEEGEIGKENPDEEKPSYDSIVSKYYGMLSSLEARANSQADSLIAKAKAEYDANKNNPGFSSSELYDKYKSMAESIASEIDGQVSSVLSSLESELSNNGYDTSVVGDFQAQYDAAKAAAGL